jgi:hypothetical protein
LLFFDSCPERVLVGRQAIRVQRVEATIHALGQNKWEPVAADHVIADVPPEAD